MTVALPTPEELLKQYGPEAVEKMLQEVDEELLVERSKTWGLDGFRAWFELMHRTPLHPEGEKWAEDFFLAWNTTRKLLVEAFRGSGKTKVLTTMAFSFYLGHFPHTVSGIIRVNDDKATETTREIASIIERDARWKKVFPHIVPDKSKGWGERGGFFLKRDDISEAQWQEEMSRSSRPLGATFNGYGWASGSVIGSRWNGMAIIDDIHDRENTRSDRQMRQVRQFITDTFLPIPVPGETMEVWCFTPWQLNDAYASRKSIPTYIHSHSPAIRAAEQDDEDAPMWPDNPDVPFSGKRWHLSWPERFGFQQLEEVYLGYRGEEAGPADFARMYMLDLEVLKGQNLKTEWLHEYPREEISEAWPVIFGIDYASTADKIRNTYADYFAMSIYRAIPGGGLVLVDGVRKRQPKAESLDTVATYAGMYPRLHTIGVETLGGGKDFYNDLALINDRLGRALPLIPITHGKRSKGERFENWLAPRFRIGRIYISDAPTPFLNAFREEWMMWPNASHDDCLDAAYMGAAAAEGYIPSKAERTFGRDRKNDTSHLKALAGV